MLFTQNRVVAIAASLTALMELNFYIFAPVPQQALPSGVFDFELYARQFADGVPSLKALRINHTMKTGEVSHRWDIQTTAVGSRVAQKVQWVGL